MTHPTLRSEEVAVYGAPPGREMHKSLEVPPGPRRPGNAPHCRDSETGDALTRRRVGATTRMNEVGDEGARCHRPRHGDGDVPTRASNEPTERASAARTSTFAAQQTMMAIPARPSGKRSSSRTSAGVWQDRHTGDVG